MRQRRKLDTRNLFSSVAGVPQRFGPLACAVTDRHLLQGVRFCGDGVRTQSIVLTLDPNPPRLIETIHLENRPDVKVRFS